jgi:hypothetical protein
MRFHFFRPLHGWREFVHEIVIVVLGVLIALGADISQSFQNRISRASLSAPQSRPGSF